MTVSEKLRLVQGLHSHAEMFGFHWDDGSDWTWHDVACKIADEIDAESEGLRQELAIRAESEKVIEYLRQENVDWEDKYRELSKENVRLQGRAAIQEETIESYRAECAELRELLAKMLYWEQRRGPHGERSKCLKCPIVETCDGRCEFYDYAESKARELGVEIKE